MFVLVCRRAAGELLTGFHRLTPHTGGAGDLSVSQICKPVFYCAPFMIFQIVTKFFVARNEGNNFIGILASYLLVAPLLLYPTVTDRVPVLTLTNFLSKCFLLDATNQSATPLLFA